MTDLIGIKMKQTLDGLVQEEFVGEAKPFQIILEGPRLALREGTVYISTRVMDKDTGELFDSKERNYSADILNIPDDEELINCNFKDLKDSIGLLSHRILLGEYEPEEEGGSDEGGDDE